MEPFFFLNRDHSLIHHTITLLNNTWGRSHHCNFNISNSSLVTHYSKKSNHINDLTNVWYHMYYLESNNIISKMISLKRNTSMITPWRMNDLDINNHDIYSNIIKYQPLASLNVLIKHNLITWFKHILITIY